MIEDDEEDEEGEEEDMRTWILTNKNKFHMLVDDIKVAPSTFFSLSLSLSLSLNLSIPLSLYLSISPSLSSSRFVLQKQYIT